MCLLKAGWCWLGGRWWSLREERRNCSSRGFYRELLGTLLTSRRARETRRGSHLTSKSHAPYRAIALSRRRDNRPPQPPQRHIPPSRRLWKSSRTQSTHPRRVEYDVESSVNPRRPQLYSKGRSTPVTRFRNFSR